MVIRKFVKCMRIRTKQNISKLMKLKLKMIVQLIDVLNFVRLLFIFFRWRFFYFCNYRCFSVINITLNSIKQNSNKLRSNLEVANVSREEVMMEGNNNIFKLKDSWFYCVPVHSLPLYTEVGNEVYFLT